MMNWLPDGKLPADIAAHPGWRRLEDQLAWYDSQSSRNHRVYLRIKACQIILASAIPLLALMDAPPQIAVTRWLTAVAGAVIAVLEALQQLNQYSQHWIEYRSMAERLKRDKYLFLAGTGPYHGLHMEARLATLARRVEDLASTEHEQWAASAMQALNEQKEAAPPAAGTAAPAAPGAQK